MYKQLQENLRNESHHQSGISVNDKREKGGRERVVDIEDLAGSFTRVFWNIYYLLDLIGHRLA